MIGPSHRGHLLGVVFGLALSLAPASGQDAVPFEKTSLSLRTALHFDPGAEAPLRTLVTQYQQAGKVTELIGLYLSHVAQFPSDEGAKVVLARLLITVGDSRSDDFLNTAIAAHPQNALLAFARSELMRAKFAPGALEELDRAIALETRPSRRALWLGDLIKSAVSQQREDLVAARLVALVRDKALTPSQRVQWARRALEAGLAKAAAAVLAEFHVQDLEGEEGVEARFVLARSALAGGHRDEAARLAAELVEMLAADHWRRQEALNLRWQSAPDEPARERLLSEAAQRWQAQTPSEADALAYADLLAATGRRAESVKVLTQAAIAWPASRILEGRLLDLFEHLHQPDQALSFLTERLRLTPERADLALRHARWLLMLGRAEEGLAAMDKLLARAEEKDRGAIVLQTARWLRTRNLLGEAARLLETFVTRHPQRWDARKELAEILALLKRPDDIERLFAAAMPDDLAPELRMEVVQFLLFQRLWPLARRGLENWVEKRPAEFDARLLLARVCALQGDENAAHRRLEECRAQTDTEARYAAWLAAAWEWANEREKVAEFIEGERQRLWPPSGGSRDALQLAKLSLFAQQTVQGKLLAEAEKLIRETLATAGLPIEHQLALHDQLIRLLDGQKNREKDLETEITKLLEEPYTAQGDLRLRLSLVYHGAQRHDLARNALEQADVASCKDAALVGRAAALARDLGLQERASALYEKLVRLKPEERSSWSEWATLLSSTGDEEKLRAALREMSTFSAKWQLTTQSQDLLRRHLAASYWRSIVRLSTAEESRDAEALAMLGELERSELTAQGQTWADWARGVLALRSGDNAALAEAKAALAASKDEWVDFPDGLSLSMTTARAMLAPQSSGTTTPQPKAQAIAPMQSPTLAWGFAPEDAAALQRWELTPDGQSVLVMDARRIVHMLDRSTGKLLWKRRMTMGRSRGIPVMAAPPRGDEQVSYPAEWAIGDEQITLMDENGLICWRRADGVTLWQLEIEQADASAHGSLTMAEGRVLWWRPEKGLVDAFDAQTGKLVWTQPVEPLAEPPKANGYQPAWLASGIHADAGRVLVWGNGAAVLEIKTGRTLWRASVAKSPLSFPLEIRAETDPAPSPAQATIVPWTAANGMRRMAMSNYRGAGMGRAIPANPLAVPSYGYPGMYGTPQATPWLTWGTDGTRVLRGDGIWVISQQHGTVRYSAFGFPAGVRANNLRSGPALNPIGFAGKGLIVASETGAARVLPDGTAIPLFTINRHDNRPAEHPMLTVALEGTTLLLATRDSLRVQDAISGTILWESEWPKEAAAWASDGWHALDAYQSLRWSARGVSLHDGQSRTLTVDWKALSAGGDWIIPAGVTKLVCLRSAAVPSE